MEYYQILSSPKISTTTLKREGISPEVANIRKLKLEKACGDDRPNG